MGKFTNFLKNAKNKFSNNLKEYNKAKDEESGASDIKKTILWIKVALAAVPIVFFGAGVVLLMLAAAAPMIVITGVVTDIADSVKDFGASVGNFFTSGCYGTDAECAARDEAKAEQAFFDAVEKVYNVYALNENNAMKGDLKDDKYNQTQSGWEKTSYSPVLNVPVLLSTFMYGQSPSDGYYELINGTNYINDIANIEKKMDVLSNDYTWYADENDPVKIKYDEVFKKAGTNTSKKQCGSYDEVIKKALARESGYENLIEYHNPEDKNWWYQLGDFFHVTEHYKRSQMRVLAKKLITKKIESTCKDGEITTRVKYEYDEEAYKKFLKEDYLEDILIAKYITSRYEEWLKSEGYIIISGDVVKSDGSSLTKEEKKNLQTKGEAKLTELKNRNYTPTDKEYDEAITYIISSSEYFEYIYEELMNSKGVKVKVCAGVNVITDNNNDPNAQKVYELEDLVAGFTTNLEKIYAKSGTAVEASVREAASIIYRTYILERSEFCTEPIHVTTREDGKYMNYITPSKNATDAADATRGQVIYSGESMLASNSTTYEYLAYVNQYNSRPGAGAVSPSRPSAPSLTVTYPIPVKLQSVESAASSILAANRTAEEIIKKYYTGYPEIALKRVTGSLVGGKYASAAPKRENLGSTKQNGQSLRSAVDYTGKKIFDPNIGLIGQCVWYAQHRAREIVIYSDMDEATKAKALNAILSVGRNGGGWNANNSSLGNHFEFSNNPREARPGSIISWVGGNQGCSSYYYSADKEKYLRGCGHVAIVEEVLADGSIIISDGWRTQHNGEWNYSDPWGDVNARFDKHMTLSQIMNNGGQIFGGYVYLLG